MIDVKIEGPSPNGKNASNAMRINSEGAVGVVLHNHPAKNLDKTPSRPYREFLTTAAGSSAMAVDGSVTNVVFSVDAETDLDVYIKSLSFAIVDAGATLSEFGNLAALSNGVVLDWSTGDLGVVTIADALKTNFDVVRLCLGNPAFGSAANSFQAPNVITTSEAYIPVLDFQVTFGMPFGIRLRKGSLDKIRITIRDDLSTLTGMDVIAYGLRI